MCAERRVSWLPSFSGSDIMSLRLIARIGAGLITTLLAGTPVHAQSPFVEQFTGTTSSNSWYFYDGACLTAGTAASTRNPGPIPGCKSIAASYYRNQSNADAALVGGERGYLGSSNPPFSPALLTPDSPGNGALRFTNGFPYGMEEDGAIVSAGTFPSANGMQITFKTVTYRGITVDYGEGEGAAQDGADGIGFFLIDGATDLGRYPGVGAFGGSLGYSCSNRNFDTNPRSAGLVRGFDGLVGAYLGIGVDEYGNYLNGSVNTLGLPSNGAIAADNTATGGGYVANIIGLRGAGSVSWMALRNAYGSNPYDPNRPYYPASLASQCPRGSGNFDPVRGYCAQCSFGPYNQASGTCSNGAVLNKQPPYSSLAVSNTCASGMLFNYSNPDNPTSAGAATLANRVNTAKILDYAAIAGTPLSNLGPGYLIANESAQTRTQATAITYHLKMTSNNLLSLSFSYNGGTYQPVITDRDLVSSIGPMPQNVRFGFTGATGGSTNVHEILCFQATPGNTSSSAAGVNTYQNPVINPGSTQLFLAYYVPESWSGRVTAQSVAFNAAANAVTVNTVPNWDASCVLTGVNSATGPCSTGVANLAAQDPTSRTMLTWNGTRGIAFEWNSLTAAQRAMLSQADANPAGADRLAYLRGTRTREINTSGVGLFRTRAGVLGDVVDSSPTWVGPPQTYSSTVTWADKLYPGATAPESGGQSYAAFQAQQQSRLNVVYVGANDGFLHGFRAGSLDSSGTLVNSLATPNDGREVLAYMPGAILQSDFWSSSASPTQSQVQNIHGVVPANPASGTSASVKAALDFSSPQYGHNYFVDATPATGDVFFAGQWHTWLVGGLGAGGAAIYALDVTQPGAFSEQSPAPANIVIGEWTGSNLTCVNVSGCGTYLGNTYGTPIIRRFHNGSWGVIFGNGYGSPNGAAGIYIMLIDPASGGRSFYYLGTAQQSGANGIASPSSLDLDLDHIVDYVYAGDLLGNLWRFDLTSLDPAQWAVSASSPLFNAGQPITTALAVGTRRTVTADSTYAGLTFSHAPERVILDFGTGRQIPQTATSGTQYAAGAHYLYGIWDWDMSAWNKLSAGQQAVSLTAPQTISTSNLQQQTITNNTNTTPATRTVSSSPVCWKGATNCGSGQQTQFGWSVPLPGNSGDTTIVNGQAVAVGEQILFDPHITADGELVVNTYIPALDTPLICTPAPPTGFTMAVEPDSGEQSATAYLSVGGQAVSGVQTNGVGVPLEVTSGSPSDHNAEYLITQTSSGQAATPVLVNRHTIVTGQRLSWTQRR
jgi:type IV pilus assembly protein PilY1